MKKFSSSSTDKLLLKYVIKIIVSTIASILFFSFIFSEITYRLDLDLEINKIFSIVICGLCSAIIAFISVHGLKNNGILMGIIAQIPLIFYSLINLIFYENSALFFLIKLVIIVLAGALSGFLTTKNANNFKVK